MSATHPQTTLAIWLAASRPKTLPASVTPVLMGTAMAFGDGVQHWLSAGVTLIAALLIQIGTNFANDYFDCLKGADSDDRVGPVRVVQAGLVRPQSMRAAFLVVFLFAALASCWLSLRAGWPLAVIGVLAIVSGILYTAGPFPLGYRGWGEIFVLIFFGPVAVAGTYYVQSLEMNPAVLMAGWMPGLFSTAVLVVNNLRDIESDRRAGKRTLAVRFGKSFARAEYFVCLVIACLGPIGLYFQTRDHPYTLCAAWTLVLAFPALRRVYQEDGVSLNQALSYTGILAMIFAVIFSVGWIL